jgi:hypothetical protein
LQPQVGASAAGAPNKKPHRASRLLRLLACRFAAQFLGLEVAVDKRHSRARARVQLTAPSHEMHVATAGGILTSVSA